MFLHFGQLYFCSRCICEQKQASWAPITRLKKTMLSHVVDTLHSQKKRCSLVTIKPKLAIVFAETYYLDIASKEMCPVVYFLTTQQNDVSRFRPRPYRSRSL